VSAAQGKVYVADTNNHVVRVVDGETGEVGTLAVAGAILSS
jgi:DNA-binding beta-propeller fold protein YncE